MTSHTLCLGIRLPIVISFALTLASCSPAPDTTPTSESLSITDFGPTADLITFENLTKGATVMSQFLKKGLLVRSTDGSPIKVVDMKVMDESHRHPSPYAISTSSPGALLEIVFTSPRRKVGMSIGPLDKSVSAILKAFDDQDRAVKQVSILKTDAARTSYNLFIGVAVSKAQIHRVQLDVMDAKANETINYLMAEPGQDVNPDVVEMIAPARAALLAAGSTQKNKLKAIITLQRNPSTESSLLLQKTAKLDSDLYVREQAIMALAQIRDADSIPTLVEVGLDAPSKEVKMAAYNAVQTLRKAFPMPDPPVITVKATSPIKLGEQFDVEAMVVSPVDREHVRIRFGIGDLLIRVRSKEPLVYKGPLTAGKPVVFRAHFLANGTGRTQLPLTTRVSLNRLDATSYKTPLYIDIQKDIGRAGVTPPPGWNDKLEHVLTGNRSTGER